MIETIEQVVRTVWNELGYGYREDVYEKAMTHEMRTTHPNIGVQCRSLRGNSVQRRSGGFAASRFHHR